ncbi:putative forkhead-associated (FHA) domain-containing protein [Helianthus anomalus]
MDTKKTQKPSIATRLLKAPVKVMYKIRDLYISGMYSCASGMSGSTGPYTSGLPKSYSTTSSRASEDYAELVRIASTKSLGNKLDYPDRVGRQQTQQSTTTPVPRSQSVAIGRIDEEGSFHYTDDFRLSSDPMFLRSRSHAVSRVHA